MSGNFSDLATKHNSSHKITIYTYLAMMIILSLIIVIVNTTIIGVIIKTDTSRTPNGHFKLNIAIADLLVGIFIVPITALQMGYRSHRSPDSSIVDARLPHFPLDVLIKDKTLINLGGFFTTTTMTCSMYLLAASSIDRYLVIKNPLRSGVYVKQKIYALISFIWLFSIAIGLLPFIIPNTYYLPSSGLLVAGIGHIYFVIYGKAI